MVNPSGGRGSLKRKPEIRKAAARVFRQYSYSGASMDMLAAELGLNKGTLYHYYKGKADILFDVVLLPLRSLTEILDDIADSGTVEEQFRAFITVSVQQSVEWADEIGVYFQEMRWLSQWLDPAQLAAVNKYEARYTERLRSLLLRAQRAGVFTDTDPTAVRHAIAGMNGFLFGWFNPDGRLTVEQLSEHYADLLLNGLLARPATGSGQRDLPG